MITYMDILVVLLLLLCVFISYAAASFLLFNSFMGGFSEWMKRNLR